MQPNDANHRGYFQLGTFQCCMQTIIENLKFYSSFFDITQVAPPQPFFTVKNWPKRESKNKKIKNEVI
jgi:hypothetical protein